jgi:hypothetical protein
MGAFSDRKSVELILNGFITNFAHSYDMSAEQKCPAVKHKLPFFRQGVDSMIVYGKRPFIILSVDSKQPPFSFISRHGIMGTWDETEHAKLSKADCIDDVVEILELEKVLYYKALDSLEPKYLKEVLGQGAAQALAEQLLEDNLHTLQPTFEDAVDRMAQAYELLFRLENKLRNLIEKKLKEKFGDSDWWSKGATHNAREKYEDRRQDPRRRWHLLEDTSPLYFVDFEDLHDIIVNKNRDLFEQYIGPIDRFSVNMKSLEIPRNMIAHNNVLPSEEYYDFRRTAEALLRVIEPNLA